MTPQEKALAEWKSANPRRKGTATHYANGKPRVEGKTQKEIKEGQKNRTLNSSGQPASDKGLTHYKTDTSTSVPKKKDWFGWAGKVGQARMRNQKVSTKHYTDKGYKEDYR